MCLPGAVVACWFFTQEVEYKYTFKYTFLQKYFLQIL